MHRPSVSTTGAPLILSWVSRWAASRSVVSCGMVLTGVVIRSAAVRSRKGLVAARAVAVSMTHLLRCERSVTEPKTLSLALANSVPSNALPRGPSAFRHKACLGRSPKRRENSQGVQGDLVHEYLRTIPHRASLLPGRDRLGLPHPPGWFDRSGPRRRAGRPRGPR